MSNGFGFARFPQMKGPGPRQIGAMLMQQGMMGGGAGMGEYGPPQYPYSEPDATDPLADGDALKRAAGGHQTSGGGQSVEGDAATAHAIGDALTRLGGGPMPSPNVSAWDKQRRLLDVQRLGLTELEAQLLGLAGGL